MKRRFKIFILVIVICSLFAVTFCVAFPLSYLEQIEKECKEYGIDSTLVYAIIWTESKFDPNACSRAGAKGIMQLMPATAAWCAGCIGIEYNESILYDAPINISLGIFYLDYLIDKYGEDAIAAYNAGENAVIRWREAGEGIKYPETRKYVKTVNLLVKIYKLRTCYY